MADDVPWLSADENRIRRQNEIDSVFDVVVLPAVLLGGAWVVGRAVMNVFKKAGRAS